MVNGQNVPVVTNTDRRDDSILGVNNLNEIEAPLDLRVQYRWSNNVTLFGALDNVQNLPTDTTLRRAYRMGVRFNY